MVMGLGFSIIVTQSKFKNILHNKNLARCMQETEVNDTEVFGSNPG